jgi:hypothetical protein
MTNHIAVLNNALGPGAAEKAMIALRDAGFLIVRRELSEFSSNHSVAAAEAEMLFFLTGFMHSR